MGEDDHALVEALRRRDPAGLDGAYRRYADRLYTYARVLLRDPDGAADAVHDTFLAAASRIDQLRDPGQLRGWLYAIVRNECRRHLKLRARGVPLEAVDEPAAEVPEPGGALGAGQVRELVHAAVCALNPSDREVLDLAIRHDLSAPEVGAAMGLAPNHAHARISRARTQLERALGALVVARGGTADCRPLAALVDGWGGTLTPLLRKRISRHIDSCSVCTRRRRDQVSPAALLAAFVPAGFLVVRADVWPRLEPVAFSANARTATDPAVPRRLRRVAVDPATPRRLRRAAAGVAAAAVLVLLLGGGLVVLRPGDERRHPAAGPDPVEVRSSAPAVPSAAREPAPASATSSAPPAATSAPPTGDPPAPPAASGSPPAQSASAAPPGALAALFTVTATAEARCDGSGYTVTITATATADLAAAEVRTSTATGSRPMVARATSARVVLGPLTLPLLTWTVHASAADGRTAQHVGDPVPNPCAPIVPG